MIALIRIPAIFVYFLFVNICLITVCILRPFHRDNVLVGGKLYGSISRLLGLRIIVRGQENLPETSGVIICNHQNSYDLITVSGAVPNGTVTIGKKSLIWIPVFGWVYWLSGNILINRKNASKASDTIKATVSKIKKRRLRIWLFPEGTRSYGRGLLPFKLGAFRIARSANEPVITFCASELHNKIKLNRWNNGVLIIEIGKPEVVDDSKSLKEWSEHFRSGMQQRIAELNEEVAQLEKAQ